MRCTCIPARGIKGPKTFICSLDSGSWSCQCGGIRMATSGSADALAGLIAGLAAQGAYPLLAVQ